MDKQTFSDLLSSHALTYPAFLSLMGAHDGLSEADRHTLLQSSRKPDEIARELKEKEGYRAFIFFDAPQDFCKYFRDKEYELVQIYDMTPIRGGDIIGFTGAFKWKDNTITPLDGDSYSKPVIWGYKEFGEKDRKCLDILAEEW